MFPRLSESMAGAAGLEPATNGFGVLEKIHEPETIENKGFHVFAVFGRHRIPLFTSWQ